MAVSKNTDHVGHYFAEMGNICAKIDKKKVNELVHALVQLRVDEGRLFLLGVGGGAANASHACNDFRKLCNIEAYCPSDNVSELTARTNDEGWHTTFEEWLRTSNLCEKDALLIFSVGGGSVEPEVSLNIVNAIDLAKTKKAKVFGIVGKKQGYTAKKADICIIIPNVNTKHITPHTETMQMAVLHCLVSHTYLQFHSTRW
jgi:D-sedoheptulose 7-phosphate isomerase